MHLIVIIPVYNEAKVIRGVINSLPKKIKGINKMTVLAVNDGSTDNSADQIKKTRAILINLPINLGYGGASITGLEAAKILQADIIVTFDGDGQHDPTEIEKMIHPILSGKSDFVLGIRKINFGKMPWIKKIGNWGMSFLTSVLSGRITADSQSGFKAFSKRAINEIKVDALGYEFCSEIIIEIAKTKLKVTEVPIKVIYSQYSQNKGQSILNGVNIVFKLIFKKITG